jgi:hypothetical protein
MTALWIILAVVTFLVVSYILCKKNHQDFYKLFFQVPWWIIVAYFLWSYVSFSLTHGVFFPSSWSDFLLLLFPKNYSIHFVGLMIAALICFWSFFSSVKRIENKKIWADILFSWISSCCIILGIFFVLGDNFIGETTDSFWAIQALSSESNLTKFNGVYPVWLFLSFWALVVHVIFNSIRIFFKKNGTWILWFVALLLVLDFCFFFQSYPKYGTTSVFGLTLDIKYYISFVLIFLLLFYYWKWSKNKF